MSSKDSLTESTFASTLYTNLARREGRAHKINKYPLRAYSTNHVMTIDSSADDETIRRLRLASSPSFHDSISNTANGRGQFWKASTIS